MRDSLCKDEKVQPYRLLRSFGFKFAAYMIFSPLEKVRS